MCPGQSQEKHSARHRLCPTTDLSHQGLPCEGACLCFSSSSQWGHVPCPPPRIYSAIGNFALSQQNEIELVVVSFTVTHVVLHNNQELTGTVSFYCEQQRHWSCLSTDTGQQRIGFHFSFFVTRARNWDYCFVQWNQAQINDDFGRTPAVHSEQIVLAVLLFSPHPNKQVQVGQISVYIGEYKNAHFL